MRIQKNPYKIWIWTGPNKTALPAVPVFLELFLLGTELLVLLNSPLSSGFFGLTGHTVSTCMPPAVSAGMPELEIRSRELPPAALAHLRVMNVGEFTEIDLLIAVSARFQIHSRKLAEGRDKNVPPGIGGNQTGQVHRTNPA